MNMRTEMDKDAGTDVRYVADDFAYPVTFSVCSLVARQASYDRLLASFRAHGFTTANSEFIAADNRNGNVFDGYTWMRRLYPECRGKYVIFCHDDVELIGDGFDALLARLEGLTAVDPDWLLAGNAGGLYATPDPRPRKDLAFSIFDHKGSRRKGCLPARVETLDENFVVMRRSRYVGSSVNLDGFHMYGPDLCLMAEITGGSSYVIDFHLRHHGLAATGETFRQCKQRLSSKYGRYFPGRTIVATTGPVQLSTDHP
jgi:hypothetical protein